MDYDLEGVEGVKRFGPQEFRLFVIQMLGYWFGANTVQFRVREPKLPHPEPASSEITRSGLSET